MTRRRAHVTFGVGIRPLSSVLRALTALLLALTALAPAELATLDSTNAATWSLRDRFSREVVQRGDVDRDPYHIEHVYEVQLRLQRLGLFDVRPTGTFGPITEAGVKAFQKRNGLPVTGRVGYSTWPPLIRQSVRGRAGVPTDCKSTGWHACYDRWWHQVNLYHNGKLFSSWLVRGGSATTPTRTGRFHVYYRDVDHVSSLFNTPMPYSQFFSGGQALHGSRVMMDPYVGHRHGCVNSWTEDARQLWKLSSSRRLRVHVYGRWS